MRRSVQKQHETCVFTRMIGKRNIESDLEKRNMNKINSFSMTILMMLNISDKKNVQMMLDGNYINVHRDSENVEHEHTETMTDEKRIDPISSSQNIMEVNKEFI
jgi:hypothetical protein